MPATRQDLMAKLESLNIAVKITEHAPLFTVEDSKILRGQICGGHTKNLFMKDKKGALFLLVVGEDATINMKTMHKTLNCARLSFGKPDLLMEKLGISPGSVTAFSIINDPTAEVRIIFDETLMANDIINCHPLTNDATVSIKRDDLISFTRACGHEPTIMALAEESVASLNGDQE